MLPSFGQILTYILRFTLPISHPVDPSIRTDLSGVASPALLPIDAPCIGGAYFMTNDPSENQIVVNCIRSDGSLRFHSMVPTNGSGIYGGTAPALNSANSMVTAGNYLFAVNGGSNSVSMFEIRRDDPTDLNLVNTLNSGGLSPVALTYSDPYKMLCVANGGSVTVSHGATIMCFAVTPDGLVALPRTLKPLSVKIGKPAHGTIADVISDIGFTADSRHVMVSAKQQTLLVFPVLSETEIGGPIRNRLGVVTYSLSPLSKNRRSIVAYTDPAFGFGVFELGSKGIIRDAVAVPIPGQQLSCWLEISPRSGHLYSVDFAVNKEMSVGEVTEVKLTDNGSRLPKAEILRQYILEGPLSDARIASFSGGEFLYMLRVAPGGFGVQVMDLRRAGKAKLLQTFTPDLALTAAISGMAVYVK